MLIHLVFSISSVALQIMSVYYNIEYANMFTYGVPYPISIDVFRIVELFNKCIKACGVDRVDKVLDLVANEVWKIYVYAHVFFFI